MIKVEVINEDFTLERFGELKNIVRKNKEEKGKLFKGDVFECSEELCDYLSGNNPLKKAVVKIIEIKPKKEQWAVTKEEDGNVHVRPVVNDEIIDTPVEKIIKPNKKKKSSKK